MAKGKHNTLDFAKKTLAEHKAKAILLTCIDLRFHNTIDEAMNKLGLHGQYDQMILAGASLGAMLTFGPDRKPHWQQTFLETVALSIEVHDTEGIVIMDHMDCGAYKRYWNSMGVGAYSETKERERHSHFSAELSKLVKREVAAVKPHFFSIEWLLPKPKHESEYGDPADWSLRVS